MGKRVITGVLLVLTSALVARGQEAAWAGTWRDEATGEPRSIAVEAGQASLAVRMGESSVTCTGDSLGASLVLVGELPDSPGVVGALEPREREPRERRVRVDLQPDTDGEDGAERAIARVRLGRRFVREERWTRPGAARIELLSTEGAAGDLDPTRGPLTLNVRVLGRAQDVRLEVELPPGDRGQRPSFYRQWGARGRAIREVSLGVLEPGSHQLEWDGRDGTRAARIALQGSYVVRVDSPERRADAERPRGQRDALEVDVRVARPRAMVHAPTFTHHRSDPGATGKLAADLGTDFEVERTTASMTVEDFFSRLRTSAVCVVDTHGGRSGFMTGDEEIIRPDQVGDLMRGRDAKPLRDVHVVFLHGCNIGRPRSSTSKDGVVTQQNLTLSLLMAGVDLVVTFRSSVLASDVAAYQDLLGPRLLEYGAPIERATHDAARKAAEETSYRWNKAAFVVSAGLSGGLDAFLSALVNLESVEEALVYHAAAGVDPTTETLMPARHGCSTN